MAVDIELAEQSLLGAVLLSHGKILDDLDFNPADYRHPLFETIHRTCQTMKGAGKPIDVVTVMGELSSTGERYDPTLLHHVTEATPTWQNADYYAGIVSDAATGRRLTTAGGTIRQMVEAGGDMPEIVEASRKLVDGAASQTRQQPVEFIHEQLQATIDDLDGEIKAAPTQWPSLNELITGYMPGAVYVVGARPSVGKSVVAVSAAQDLLKHGSVAFISLEMSRADIHARLMANELDINYGRFVEHSLTEQDWQKVGSWMRNQQDRPLAILDQTAVTITDIKRFVRSVHRRKPLGGIIIDYLQLMSTPPGDKRPRHEFVADMSRQCKVLAMEFQVPVILLSQLNRGSTQREDKRPQISDLRESGAVEQDADVVILLHREVVGDRKYELGMAVAKNRRGNTGAKEFDFYGQYSRIQDK